MIGQMERVVLLACCCGLIAGASPADASRRADTTVYGWIKRARLCERGGFVRDSNGASNQSDCSMNSMNAIQHKNYQLETHTVTTEDGYILTLHRLPGRPGSVPVYLQHGLLESSVDWLLTGKGKSLAYILRDHGYDVWMGNARGNTFSKKHKTLSTSDPRFWNFSWDELGIYDLPAAITYITLLTNNSLFYIGHSMGATTFSVMAIERPEIAQRVRAMIGLAPATYVHHMKASIRLLSYFWRTIQDIMYRLGIYELFPRGPLLDIFAERVCKTNLLRDIFCSNILFLIAGFSSDQLDYNLLPAIWKRFPAGTSTKLFIHWFQQIALNRLRKFDYGPNVNLQVYNSTQPPEYDLSKMRVPTAVFWSENDLLVGERDVGHFYEQIIFKLGSYKVHDDKFNHFDFLWGLDAPQLVYNDVLRIMSQFDNHIDRY